MPDVFLSYSRKDSSEALDLASRLRQLGIDVWIDQEGINVATIWSAEIANAIRESKVFTLLLSELSLGSSNVRKEIALASQYGRPILPLDLRPVDIPSELSEYVSGLDRLHYAKTDQILSRLRAQGVAGGAPIKALSGPGAFAHGRPARRKSLMVLPFHDHSPTQDNGWFADGLVTELISGLSKTKQLRLIDWTTTKEYKQKPTPISQIAEELDVRFFVEGSVRTFGDQVKINVQLFDAYNESYLWHDTFKGGLADIFEIQEGVAEKVCEGLDVSLSSAEQLLLRDRGTANVEAFQYLLKSKEQYDKHTRDSWLNAVIFSKTATRLDPDFARARTSTASTLVELYRLYDRNPVLLEEAEAECALAEASDPTDFKRLGVLARIALQRRETDKARQLMEEYITREPELYDAHYTMAMICQLQGDPATAVKHYEICVGLDPHRVVPYWNLVVACEQSEALERKMKWSRIAVPHFERRVRRNPDDENAWVWLTNMLHLSGEEAAAIEQLRTLPEMSQTGPLYNLACFSDRIGEKDLVISFLRRAIAAGFDNIEMLEDGWDEYKQDPAFQQLLDELRHRVTFKET